MIPRRERRRSLEGWLSAATAGLHPDECQAVIAELRDHYRDTCAAYAEGGLSPAEAEAAALHDLGAAGEIAGDFRQVWHAPLRYRVAAAVSMTYPLVTFGVIGAMWFAPYTLFSEFLYTVVGIMLASLFMFIRFEELIETRLAFHARMETIREAIRLIVGALVVSGLSAFSVAVWDWTGGVEPLTLRMALVSGSYTAALLIFLNSAASMVLGGGVIGLAYQIARVDDPLFGMHAPVAALLAGIGLTVAVSTAFGALGWGSGYPYNAIATELMHIALSLSFAILFLRASLQRVQRPAGAA